MNIKMLFAMKCFGFVIGLTIYNYIYDSFINDIILNSINGIKEHFDNSTIKLPDP
mgnify:CR=1 FL=1